MPSNGITVYLSEQDKARVRKKAADEYRSESSVIAEAVKVHFRPREAESEEKIAERYMGRIDARLQKVVGEGLILKEVVLLFIRVWLEHNPPIDEAHEDAAAASAEARFERFLGLVRDGLQGHSLANGQFNHQASTGNADPSQPSP